MRIVQLTAENVKRLKVVDITPDANFQAISGKNGSGKSSVLDSLFYALAGASVIPGKPVREGCERAKIRLNLGEIAVERKFRASDGKTTVEVINEDGSTWKSPQAMLDALLGELTFDPLAFSRMKARDQFLELRKVSKLSIDIDAINASNTADYAKRTDINREAKQKRTQAEAIVIPGGTPTDLVSESDLLDGIEEAGKFNADIERRKQNRLRAQQDIEDLKGEYRNILGQINPSIEAANKRIENLRQQLTEAEREKEQISTSLNKQADEKLSAANSLSEKLVSAGHLPDPISIATLRVSLDAAMYTNVLAEKRKQKQAIMLEAEQAEQASQKLTGQMADRERQVADAIKAADMPIPGLGFGSDCVLFNGLPFEQASDAERLRVSTAIAMAANPKLRIIRIKDGSLLDDDGMNLIAQMAHEKDFQVFVERVDTSGKIGIFMEDGEVAAVNA